MNLLGNAVKFTDEGTVRLDVTLGPDHGHIEFRVTDTGPGVNPDLHESIFEPFKRDALQSTTKPGTGLGLAISRDLAHAMKGSLRVDPSVSNGACFVLELPLRVSEALNKKDHLDLEPDVAPLSILVAEDVPANQFVIKTMLNRMGHSVRKADNGQLAVEAFDADDFDLILLDVQMPVMDGFTAARAIRAGSERGKNVPIIALTAFTQDSDRDSALSAGIDAFLSKPIRVQQLIETIREVRTATRATPAFDHSAEAGERSTRDT